MRNRAPACYNYLYSANSANVPIQRHLDSICFIWAVACYIYREIVNFTIGLLPAYCMWNSVIVMHVQIHFIFRVRDIILISDWNKEQKVKKTKIQPHSAYFTKIKFWQTIPSVVNEPSTCLIILLTMTKWDHERTK